MNAEALILAELQALHRKVDEQREELQHMARRLIPAQDREELRALLPLVDSLMGDGAWTLASLYAAAMLAPAADDLRRRLEEWNTETGGFRELGHVLMRARGTVHRGLRLVYVEAGEREGSLYMVVRVSGRVEPAPAVAPRAVEGDHD